MRVQMVHAALAAPNQHFPFEKVVLRGLIGCYSKAFSIVYLVWQHTACLLGRGSSCTLSLIHSPLTWHLLSISHCKVLVKTRGLRYDFIV